ncbi:hypothetical protein HYH03_009279 [Edaphochlamys debaryana]|uniref:Uncharacterized protein n=1 Tax=Edaphochlamys debaryana TaxID=47281 RepID=A0A836BYI0_9CHLO|nr:hypothetical protein HYH03_009279 [Edaphochlamys debaryana]|eukprot:KAG2492328.1 hypothetical protein HYH03_009279 [Edaphochlamys debaryana]
MEVAHALITRFKRWQQRMQEMPAPTDDTSRGNGGALAAETEALQAVLQATSAHLRMHELMKDAIERGVLETQDKIDKVDFMFTLGWAKAAISKLQSLEPHFMNAAYKAEDVAALAQVHTELAVRLETLRSEVTDAQKRLSVYRGLGPLFHQQLEAYREVQQKLTDAQYCLRTFSNLESEIGTRPAEYMDTDAHMY